MKKASFAFRRAVCIHVQPEPQSGESPTPVENIVLGSCKTVRLREPHHFRPVALPSHLMKTMERIVLTHLRHLVNSEMDPLQFAYRPGIGVDDAVIYLLHRSLSHLESTGCSVRVMFSDFSSAFNTIQPSLLRGKLEGAGVDCHLAAWTTDYLTNRPQYVRFCDYVSVVCSMGAPQGTALSSFLFTLYTSDFSCNTDSCHLQKFSDDTAIVARVSEVNDLEHREVITNFVAWCELNHLCINARRDKKGGDRFQEDGSSDCTSEHPGFGH